MARFNIAYVKDMELSVLHDLAAAGVTIVKNFQNLGVMTVDAPNEASLAISGIASIEADASINVSLSTDWARRRLLTDVLPLRATYGPLSRGRGGIVYLVDSGVDTTHVELATAVAENRITNLYSFDGTFTDPVGHGTALAGLILGDTLGVAPDASIRVVKIPGGSTTLSVLLEAFDAVLGDHSQTAKTKVVNCSWDIAKSQILDSKILELQAAGLVVVAAAGNAITNADNFSPIGLNSVLGVGASDPFDRVIAWSPGAGSNWGVEVDITAPGIYVTVPSSQNSYTEASGTSFSAATTSGAVCHFIEEHPDASAVEIEEILLNAGVNDILFRNETIYGTTPNKLLRVRNATDVWTLPKGTAIEVRRGEVSNTPITGINGLLHSFALWSMPDSPNALPISNPSWASIVDGSLVLSPPVELAPGKYAVMIRGTFDGVEPITRVNQVTAWVYGNDPSELNDPVQYPEQYTLQSGSNVNVNFSAACNTWECTDNVGCPGEDTEKPPNTCGCPAAEGGPFNCLTE